MDPVVLSGTAQRSRAAGAGIEDGAHRLGEHQAADQAEEGDVGDRDDQVELADRAQGVEDDDPDERPGDARQHEHGSELHVDHAPPPVGQRRRRR